MNYQEFTDILSEEIKLRGNIEGELIYSKSQKNNGTEKQTLVIKREDSCISPSLILDYYYNEYLDGRSISDICESIEAIVNTQPDFSETDFSLSWDRVKDCVIFVVVNREANKDFLNTAPHIPFLDFAIVFKIDTVFLNIAGYISITNEILSVLKVDFKTLLEAARKNTPRLEPLRTLLLPDMIKELRGEDVFVPEDLPDVLVCTNTDKNYGASCLLYDDFEEVLERELGTKDCYVIPSSIHELLLVDDEDEGTREHLELMVKDVNSSDCLPETDFLSNRVYRLSEIKKALTGSF